MQSNLQRRAVNWSYRAAILSLTLVVTAAGATVSSPRACACSCLVGPWTTPDDDPAALGYYDAIFVGVPTNESTRGNDAVYDLEVRGVYTGTVGPTTTVSTETQCCVCDVTYTLGEDTYVFAAVGDDGQLVADSCSPAGDWGGKPSDEWMAALRDAYGEPRPPVAT